ncbi:Plant UBX domain-containing protein 10 [Raphanus sativus]|uniref:Plant UBX domain-containing protein 10 n=1 Tax=Raphanus sativus TaxID=3726 RepID=A0A6J0L969_RAPSA|nr:plant UBX domain-containing protein 10 [Raphanus sativus]KAJ4876212.1 Plant UBX domain-containing protein 10 [Raphanus sativus]
MVDVADKLGYFQAITGLEDADLCTEILQAHGWDLELAISSFTSSSSSSSDPLHNHPSSSRDHNRELFTEFEDDPAFNDEDGRPPGIAWKIITLPVSIVSGSLGLASTAIGFGFRVAGGALTYSLGMLGFGSGRSGGSGSGSESVSLSAGEEAMEFISLFDRDYGRNPCFVSEGFMDALQRSRTQFKLLFVYLHSPDHPDTPPFCDRTLCNEGVVAFLNENFVAWGASVRSSEGFKMSNSFKASRFPFCAVVMPAANHRIALLHQVEGPTTPEEMIAMMQRVVEDSSTVLVTARVEAEERRNNLRLREEQDAAYRAALEADQAREQERLEEQERIEREAAEAEMKRKEEDEARERAEREGAEREAARVRMRQEKALALGDEPEKGPDVTQVLVRFPNGERKGRRFESNTKIQTLYDYVDSLGVLETEDYSLITNFPRTLYGRDKESMSLKDAGLHPQASLFIEIN